MTSKPLAKKKRSGGPRTLAGKVKASQNAIKTGAYTSSLILPHENHGEYQELERCLMEEYQPVGITEIALVKDLARCLWKKARLDRVEHSNLIALMSQPIAAEEYFRAGYQRERDRRVDWILERIHGYGEEEIDFLRFGLRFAELARDKRDFFLEQVAFFKEHGTAEFCEEIIAEYEEAKSANASGAKRVVASTRGTEVSASPKDRLSEEHLKVRIDGLIEERELILSIYDDKPELERLKPIIFDLRQSAFMERSGMPRAREDLNREFHRTLKEFRLQREWRLEHQPIDIIASKY